MINKIWWPISGSGRIAPELLKGVGIRGGIMVRISISRYNTLNSEFGKQIFVVNMSPYIRLIYGYIWLIW